MRIVIDDSSARGQLGYKILLSRNCCTGFRILHGYLARGCRLAWGGHLWLGYMSGLVLGFQIALRSRFDIRPLSITLRLLLGSTIFNRQSLKRRPGIKTHACLYPAESYHPRQACLFLTWFDLKKLRNCLWCRHAC